ncbi:MAG: hypothetical protein QM811_31415 [Pirellulales bacterium]
MYKTDDARATTLRVVLHATPTADPAGFSVGTDNPVLVTKLGLGLITLFQDVEQDFDVVGVKKTLERFERAVVRVGRNAEQRGVILVPGGDPRRQVKIPHAEAADIER